MNSAMLCCYFTTKPTKDGHIYKHKDHKGFFLCGLYSKS
jgi:hypothetical protein